jgi:hypothetical protein
MSTRKIGGFNQQHPKARQPVTWTEKDQAALDKLMSASYALTKPELARLHNLLAKKRKANP